MVGTAFVTLSNVMTTALAANPYLTAIIAIIAALAALGLAIYEIVKNWDQISDAAQTAFANIKSSASDGLSNLKGIGQKIISSFMGIPEAIKEVGQAFAGLLNPAKQAVDAVVRKFMELKQNAFKLGKEMLQAFGDGINSVINSVISTVQRLASNEIEFHILFNEDASL